MFLSRLSFHALTLPAGWDNFCGLVIVKLQHSYQSNPGLLIPSNNELYNLISALQLVQ